MSSINIRSLDHHLVVLAVHVRILDPMLLSGLAHPDPLPHHHEDRPHLGGAHEDIS